MSFQTSSPPSHRMYATHRGHENRIITIPMKSLIDNSLCENKNENSEQNVIWSFKITSTAALNLNLLVQQMGWSIRLTRQANQWEDENIDMVKGNEGKLGSREMWGEGKIRIAKRCAAISIILKRKLPAYDAWFW